MFTILRHIPRAALTAAAISALLISLCPAALQAQQALSAGNASTKAAKGLNDPDFVGKWDFNTAGKYDAWRPLQAAGTFESRDGLVIVTAKSQRPCLDLSGPYSAAQIGAIEIRIRGVEVERETPSGSAEGGSMGGAGDRVKILPQLYQGTRFYFTIKENEKFNAEHSIEVDLPLDGKFHVLTVNPHDHPAWTGLIQKIRLDIGDFPNHYELDYIYFHRAQSAKKGDNRSDKSAGRVGAISTEPKK